SRHTFSKGGWKSCGGRLLIRGPFDGSAERRLSDHSRTSLRDIGRNWWTQWRCLHRYANEWFCGTGKPEHNQKRDRWPTQIRRGRCCAVSMVQCRRLRKHEPVKRRCRAGFSVSHL